MRRSLIALCVAFAAAGGAYALWRHAQAPVPGDAALRLYGNVEIRQVDLAFGVEGPIARVLVDEGDRVKAGQVLASLDEDAFRYAFDSAEAALRNAQARLAELAAGARAQELDRARAEVAAAEASQENAATTLARVEELFRRQTIAQQALDSARMGQRTAAAELRVAQSVLALLTEGTRAEQIDQQRAEVAARAANLALQRYRRDRSTLRAPSAGVVLTRVREPGAVVLPNSPVLTVSVIDPVWIRLYVDEPSLGQTVPGRRVRVTTDAEPGRSYAGTIGFVSPTAEFTPRSVETPSVRTTLVYRVRVIVENPDHALRQGMPATVELTGAPPDRTP